VKKQKVRAGGMEATELVEYLDRYLRTFEVPDYPTALNGLQVEAPAKIHRIALAVDSSEQAIEESVAAGCQLLIVHHGLFWDGLKPVTERRYRRLKRCIDGQLGVYGSHIPLDLHPEVGNSIVLARALGVDVKGWWGEFHGVPIGVHGTLAITREALTARLDDLLGGRVRLLAGGPEQLKRVGVLTGAGGSMINEAIRAGLDGLVTGEGAHHTYFDALEGGINVYYGGHYATETWGLKALGDHLTSKFGLATHFIDLPTGL
jgi:dinuclear metal center YbgI/SA1388 family protein